MADRAAVWSLNWSVPCAVSYASVQVGGSVRHAVLSSTFSRLQMENNFAFLEKKLGSSQHSENSYSAL